VFANDELWQRAVAIAAFNRDRVPGEWSEREETFNDEGESHLVTSTRVTFAQVRSEVDVRLVEATSNGLDITPQIQEIFEDRRDTFSMREQYNPFLPQHQKNVSAKREGRTRRDGEMLHIAYDYSHKTEDGRWRGLVWIDEATGMPLELTARLTGLPKKDVKDEIRERVLNVSFEGGEERVWYTTKIVIFTRATLNNFPYSGFYGTIEKAITLANYWKISFN